MNGDHKKWFTKFGETNDLTKENENLWISLLECCVGKGLKGVLIFGKVRFFVQMVIRMGVANAKLRHPRYKRGRVKYTTSYVFNKNLLLNNSAYCFLSSGVVDFQYINTACHILYTHSIAHIIQYS